jgi:uncharacterized protein (TIGR01777 family)
MERRVVITGGTGFIGGRLCALLLDRGYEPVVLSRRPEKVSQRFAGRVRGVVWDGRSAEGWIEHADGAYAIVNLAGASIGSGRWAAEVKRRVLESRVDAGGAVLEAIERADVKPQVLVQGSAVGYYADCGDNPIDEAGPRGGGFLAGVVERWEESTREVASRGVRVVAIRTAMVLGRGGVLLDRLALPLRLFVGGPVGSGRQWVPWIHLDDEVGAIHFLIERPDLSGVFNLASPHPLRNAAFMRALGAAVGRPSWLKIPGFVLKAALGEMAEELVLRGMRVQPRRLLDAGFQFRYPDIESALHEIYG